MKIRQIAYSQIDNLSKEFIFKCLKMFPNQRRKDDPALPYGYIVYAFEGYLSLKMSFPTGRMKTFF